MKSSQLLTFRAGGTVTAPRPPPLGINHWKPPVVAGQAAGLPPFSAQGRPRALKPILPPTCGVPPLRKASSCPWSVGAVRNKTADDNCTSGFPPVYAVFAGSL